MYGTLLYFFYRRDSVEFGIKCNKILKPTENNHNKVVFFEFFVSFICYCFIMLPFILSDKYFFSVYQNIKYNG